MSSVLEHSAELSLEGKRALLAQLLREKAKKASSAPLSFAQQRLWFLDQLEPGNAFYNMPQATRIGGELNVQILHQAFNTIIMRHESLRTTFSYLDGSPVQVVNKSAELQLPVMDLSQLPAAERESEARRLATEEAKRPFDLAEGPLMRASLLRLAEDDHVLLLTMHHIVSDGWSAGILMRELTTLYEAFSEGKPSPLAELPIQYADYAVWQREWLQGQVLKEQLAYWSERLGGELPRLELPTDKPRPVVQTYRGSSASTKVSKDLTEQLKAMAQGEGVTLYMLLLAAFQILLSRYSGQEDVIVGSPIAGRNRAETESLIGFFINTLALRTNLSGNPTFRNLLQRVREAALGAYEHQDLPFEKLVEELQPERSLSYSPIFQMMFALQNAPSRALKLGELKLSSFGFENKTTRFDLEVHLWERADGTLTCSFVYNTDLFDAATVTRMLTHYQTLLESVVADPGQHIWDLALLTAEERQQLLVDWNHTQTDYPRDKTIQELFEEQVERTPEAIAVVYEEKRLSYRKLNEKANQLAHYLQKLGVGPEVMVAISMERSVEMVVGLLGILKAGAAYVPLDPDYPEQRLRFMLEDTRAPVLITQESLVESLPGSSAEVICLDKDGGLISQESTANLNSGARAENLAYVIYTSGSTGLPKGVSVPHRAVTRLVLNTNYIKLKPSDKVAQVSNASFDAVTFEIWGALLCGAQLVGISMDVALAPQRLSEQIQSHGITTMFLTTALFNQMAIQAPNCFKRMRHLMFGGEAVDPKWVREILVKGAPERLLHVYGPTESTTFTSWHVVQEVEEGARTIPIGRPISNTTIYILDRQQQLVPIGVSGELHIGGDGLAAGYLNRSGLTTEKFIPHPYSQEEGARLYKTGDLARYLPDGNVEFVGRIDQQVKIRGFRIELGEIEAVLMEHPALREVVVAACEETGEKRLVAYLVVGEGLAPGVSELRSYLKERLPDYMVPSAFIVIDEMPLTPNGKVDRSRLPAPEQLRPELEEGFVAPRDELERQLSNLWEEILSVKPIGVTDNFFELGGHSLLAVRLFGEIEKRFNKNLPIATLFHSPTIEHLSGILRQEGWVSSWSSLVPIKPSGLKPPLYFVHPGGGNVLCYRALAGLLGSDQPVYGLQAQGLDGKLPPHQSIEEMAAHYIEEIRALQLEGPYYLGGASSGGVLAFEIAQQLHAQGQEVGLLAMIDTFFPGIPRYLRNPTLLNSKFHRMLMRADVHLGHLLILRPKEQLRYVLDGVGRIKKNLKKKIVNRFSSEEPLRRTIQRVRDVNSHAFRIYKPKPYPGRITYFWCSEMMFRSYMDYRLGWDAVAGDGLDVHMVPGSHTGLLDIEPHTKVLADELKKCLHKIQTAAPYQRTADSKAEA